MSSELLEQEISQLSILDNKSYISVNEVHSLVPKKTIQDIMDKYNLDKNDTLTSVYYLTNLLMRGELELAKKYIETLPVDQVRLVVNEITMENYYGTLLHILLYWNNDEEAFRFYNLLTSLGAKLIKDHYDELPFEQSGCLYVVDRYITYNRNIDEFNCLYDRIRELEKNM